MCTVARGWLARKLIESPRVSRGIFAKIFAAMAFLFYSPLPTSSSPLSRLISSLVKYFLTSRFISDFTLIHRVSCSTAENRVPGEILRANKNIHAETARLTPAAFHQFSHALVRKKVKREKKITTQEGEESGGSLCDTGRQMRDSLSFY